MPAGRAHALFVTLETAWPLLTALCELTIYVDAVDEDVPGTLEDNECKLERICFVEDMRVRPPPHELILSVPCIRETMAIIQASIRADIPHLVLSGIPILRPTDFSDAPTVRVSLEPHMPREDYRWWWELGLLDDSTLHV
ncbi:hypothetical protein EXIGLDRAFT_782738 [Exidia glandulosa HHB12029]|uniref:Uncharacterized protein n=1 Tax=Exidia glandulosa HHB12029 TaxID=1314781 RepID=A0A166NH04_EXIGL|nr:hypothetical protein EXIGLDRAFT_782738 [Exidia glandulosa HHB12029]